nr:MAG TPA: hypothetical protein [Caudoviricetes sp.]
MDGANWAELQTINGRNSSRSIGASCIIDTESGIC